MGRVARLRSDPSRDVVRVSQSEPCLDSHDGILQRYSPQ